MAFFLFCLSIFIVFLQPTSIFPNLTPYQPLRNSAIIALIAYIFSRNKLQKPFLSNKVNLFFILFIIIQVLSACQLWLTGGWETFNLWLRIGIIYYLIVKSVTNIKRLIAIAIMIILGSTYLSYYSFVNFVIHYAPRMRVGGFGWYENANDLAFMLVGAISLCLLVFNLIKNKILRLIFLIIALFFSYNVLFTASRNGLLGLLVVWSLSIILSKRVTISIKTLLIISLFIAVFVVGRGNVLSRSDLKGLRGDDSSESRITQWKSALRMVIAKPILGVGPDEFGDNAENYGGIRSLAAHNTLIQVFAESGILGGIFFFLMSFLPLYELRKMTKIIKSNNSKGSDSFIAYKFLSITLLGLWTCAFFSNRYHFYILYVIIALMVAIKSNLIDKELLNE